MERELAAIARMVTETVQHEKIYVSGMPESFAVPSIYFPVSELVDRPHTMDGYLVDYTWYVHFFHKSTECADEMARAVMDSLLGARRRVPLYSIDGLATGKYFKIDQITKKSLDHGVARLDLTWASPRSFEEPDYEYVEEFILNVYQK